MKNKEKSALKDLIINEPGTYIRYREKLIYLKMLTSKQGKQFHQFLNRDFNSCFYVGVDDNKVYISICRKLVLVSDYQKRINQPQPTNP